MTCAKKQVTCYLVKEGHVYIGTNDCLSPQEYCPRAPGEGYEKCKSICKQPGHAEEMALENAGEHASGCEAYVRGIGWYCRSCQGKLFAAGVTALRIVK